MRLASWEDSSYPRAVVWTKDKKKKASGTPASISACFLAAGTMWPAVSGSCTMTPLLWQTVSVRISPSFQSWFSQGLCHSSKSSKEYRALQFQAIWIPTQACTDSLIKCLAPQACGPLQMPAVSFNMWHLLLTNRSRRFQKLSDWILSFKIGGC